MLAVLLASLFVGGSVPGFVLAVRALPPVERMVLAGVKPWACDICSCFWASAIATVLVADVFWDPTLLLAAGPGYTLSLVLLARLERAPATFPEAPALHEDLAEKLEGP